MRATSLTYSFTSHEPYNVFNAVNLTTNAVSWNPRVQGGHLHAVLSGYGSNVNVTLDGAYTPAEGDILRITVTNTTLRPGVVRFQNHTFDEDNTPVDFIYKRDQLGGGSSWVLFRRPTGRRMDAASRAFSHDLEIHRTLAWGVVSPSTSINRQSYSIRLFDGSSWVGRTRVNSSDSSIFYGSPSSRTLTYCGVGPYVPRRIWSGVGGAYYVAGDSFTAGTSTSVFKHTGVNGAGVAIALPNNFHRNSCPIAVNGQHVLMCSAGTATGMFYSSDYGETWTRVNSASTFATRLHVTSNYMYYGASGGVWRSALGAVNSWTQVLTLPGTCDTLTSNLGNIPGEDGLIAGTSASGGMYWSLDSGDNWTVGGGAGYRWGHNASGGVIVSMLVTNAFNAELQWTTDYTLNDWNLGATIETGPGESVSLDPNFGFNFQNGLSGTYLISPEPQSDSLQDEYVTMDSWFRYFPYASYGLY